MKPFGHHLTNLLLHTLNSWLLFLILKRMTGTVWRRFWVALLFGLHPLHVQSVAWVAERKDVLSGLFGLIALWFYVAYVQKSMVGIHGADAGNQKPKIAGCFSSKHYWLALAFFALGLLSKPMLVTWPFVLILLDEWPLRRFSTSNFRAPMWKSLLWEKIPFLLLAVAASTVTYLVQKHGGAVTNFERLSLPLRLENAAISYPRYLGKFFWPENLAILYPLPHSWPAWMVIASVLLLVAVTALVFFFRKKQPFLSIGWLWFVGMLVPVIGLVQAGEQSMADRYMYLPMIGLLIALVWGLVELGEIIHFKPALQSLLAGSAAIACLLITRHEIGYWKDSVTLFQRDLAVVGDNPTAHYKLGAALNEQGRSEEAAQHFQAILKLKPDDYNALFALAVIAGQQGSIDEAISDYEAVLKLKPDHAAAHYNLGLLQAKRGQSEQAIEHYQEALRLNPNLPEARITLGVALARKGRLDEAIEQFQAAVAQNPQNPGALYNLGLAYNGKGQLNEAMTTFEQVIRLTPDNADAHNNLGLVLMRQGRLDEAIQQFQETLRLNPGHTKAHHNLEIAAQQKSPLVFPSPQTKP